MRPPNTKPTIHHTHHLVTPDKIVPQNANMKLPSHPNDSFGQPRSIKRSLKIHRCADTQHIEKTVIVVKNVMHSWANAHIFGNLRNNVTRKQTTKLKRNKPHVRATCIELPIIKVAATSRMMYKTNILLQSESSSAHSTQRKTNPDIQHPTRKSSRQKDFPPKKEPTGKSSHTTISPHENHLLRKESQAKTNNTGTSCHNESTSRDTIPTEESSYRTRMKKDKSPHRKKTPLL